MLLYRSQHLSISNPNSNFQLGKISEATKIDSIVVTWSTLGRKTFTNPGSLVDGTKNLGNLVIELSSISGNAIYASTTIPVSGVTVNIDDQYYTTSSDGKFQLNYLTQGIKNLKATKEGYDPFTKTVNIIVGTNLPLNIQMTSALFTHNLYGNIVNANDLKPIEGVIVSILNDDGTTSNLQTTSDFLGYYQVPTVPQGNRNVRFTRSSYKTKTVQLSISNSNYQYNAGLQPICLTPSVVYQNQTYNTVPIGDQCWLRENLNVGTRIPGGQNQANNSIIEKYCYNNDTINCNDGGGLYHWKEAMQYSTTEGTQGICPNGWHIPTHAELQTLTNAVNNDGNKLKRSDQGTGNGLGTDSSGFSALLAGGRDWVGNFSYLGYYATFWSSTEYDATHAYSMRLNGVTGSIHFYYGYKEDGFSVRCLKD